MELTGDNLKFLFEIENERIDSIFLRRWSQFSTVNQYSSNEKCAEIDFKEYQNMKMEKRFGKKIFGMYT